MFYKSTRDGGLAVGASEAIVKGLSADGGLFVPHELPRLGEADIMRLCAMTYPERALEILRLFLTDFTDDELKNAVTAAYGDNFDTPEAAPIAHLLTGTYVLELWHGPTCAFKDMALQILPHFLTAAMKRVIPGKKVAILTATSGDTGKAALEGFKDVPGTSIMVFYPEDGVSEMQKRQMTTQEGGNVAVCAVRGNFDDCQNGVKAIFTDRATRSELAARDIVFSSANSMNWGRLCPQIVYYASVYAELVKNKEIEYGEKINIAVPTGNFGNILAAYYAKEMGVPIGKLICASNANNVLTDFIKTGVYDRNRRFVTTNSPSMDILISSNLERLLYHLCGEDDGAVRGWFAELAEKGRYEVDDRVKARLNELFYAGWCNDEDTKKTIGGVFEDYSYLMDTHTAVAYRVLEDYRRATGDGARCVVVSTASPYKFVSAVYEALGGEASPDEFDTASLLEEKTGAGMPRALAETRDKPVRFCDIVAQGEMPGAVMDFLKEIR